MGTAVCVTGGSGFLGLHLVRKLLQRGYDVRATLRTRGTSAEAVLESFQNDYGKSLKLYEADLNHDGCFDGAMEGCTACFHSASPHPNPFPSDVKIQREQVVEPAVKGTFSALEAARKAGVKRFVLTSSFAAITELGNPQKRGYIYNEKDWNEYSDYYMAPIEAKRLSKVRTERLLWKYMGQNNVKFDAVSLNPSLIMGEILKKPTHETELSLSCNAIYNLLNGANSDYAPQGGNAWVDVEDVAEAHITALENPRANGRYIITSGYFEWSLICEILRHLCPDAPLPPPQYYGSDDSFVSSFRPAPAFGIENKRSIEHLKLKYRSIHEMLQKQVESFQAHSLI